MAGTLEALCQVLLFCVSTSSFSDDVLDGSEPLEERLERYDEESDDSLEMDDYCSTCCVEVDMVCTLRCGGGSGGSGGDGEFGCENHVGNHDQSIGLMISPIVDVKNKPTISSVKREMYVFFFLEHLCTLDLG